jgi:ParB/RepB/Spo0J family partition protein
MIVNVPINRIADNPFQPRMLYADVEDLAASISGMKGELKATCGLIHVPNGRLVIDGQPAPFSGSLPPADDPAWSVELSEGHRRYRAFKLLAESDADYATMPVNVIPMDDRTMDNMAWDENVARAELSPVEKARALQRTLDKFGLTQAALAEQRRMSPSAVSNALRLLKLPEVLLDAIHAGKLSERHGIAYLPAMDIPEADLKLAGLTTRLQFGLTYDAPRPDVLARRLVEIGDVTADQVREIVERIRRRSLEAKLRARNEQQAREQAQARAAEPAKPAPTMVATGTPSAPVPIPGLPPKSAPAAEGHDFGADPDNEFEAEARQEIQSDEAPPAPQPIVMPAPEFLPDVVISITLKRPAGGPASFLMSAGEAGQWPRMSKGALPDLRAAFDATVAQFLPAEQPAGEQILMEMEVPSDE